MNDKSEDSLDDAWSRLERLVDWSTEFYLAVIFSSSAETVDVLRDRARNVLEASGRRMRIFHPEKPADMLAAVAAIAQPESKTSHCFWLDTVAVDAADPTYALWREGYDQLILRLNESRQALRTHLGGGLVLALPYWCKSLVGQAASDLWSIRSLTIDLPGIVASTPLPSIDMADFILPPVRQDQGPTLDPDRSKDQARLLAQRGEGARPALIGNLLRAAEGYLDRNSPAESLGMAREAETLLRGVVPNVQGPDHAMALVAMAAAEEVLGELDTAAEHAAQAIALRQAFRQRDTLHVYAIAERIALRRADMRAAREAAEGALEVAQARQTEQPKDVEAKNDLLAILERVGPLRRALGDVQGARAAAEQALVLRGGVVETNVARIEAVRPSATLPPIVERLPAGEEGRHEFEKLVDRLIREWVKQNGYASHGPQRGDPEMAYDAIVWGMQSYSDPTFLCVHWLLDDIRGEHGQRTISSKLPRAWGSYVINEDGHRKARESHLCLIFPRDLNPDEIEWLHAQPKWEGYTIVEIWGMAHLEKLLRPLPALFARYYPELAAGHLPGFVPFDFRTFARHYNAQIIQDKQYVHLLGFPPDALREKDAKAHIRLADLFVPTVFRISQGGDKRTELADLLKGEKSVVVRGDPGMGKTMLLSFLALLHADGTATLKGYSPPGKRIPLFVSLREYALEDQAHDISLLEYLAKRYGRFPELRHAHPAFFEASLLMGEAILLLDGLDEVGSSAARKRMAERVRELRRVYPDCPIWVTSRIHGYTHDIALPANEFDHVLIGALDDTQVDDFLARWYQIQLPGDPEKQAEAKHGLRQAIFRTKQVRALATNPLLLTLMAFVHRFLGHLPQDRGELYEQCVNMLLRSWLEARERPQKHAFEHLGLASELPRGYLEALAFHVQEHGLLEADETSDVRGLFSRDDTLAFLTTHHLENDRRDPKVSPLKARDEMREFVDYACDRVGLLVDRGGGKLSFLHLSFQEYLAASYATVLTNIRDQESVFVGHFRDPAWSEVLLLRLYLFARKRDRAGLNMFDDLVRVMLDELGRGDDLTGWVLLGRALRDRHDMRVSQRRIILERLVRAWASEAKFEGDVFVVLEDIHVFATDVVRAELRAACAQVQSTGSPVEAVGALYLEEKLFGGVEGAAKRFGARADVSDVLADLVAFYDVPEFAALLSEKSTPDHWETAFSALDANDIHRLTLGWATGAVPCPVRSDAPLLAGARWLRRKINAEVESREAFAKTYKDAPYAALFERPGTLHWEDAEKLYAIDAPLGFAATRSAYRVDLPLVAASKLSMRALASNRLSAIWSEARFDAPLTQRMTQFIRNALAAAPPPSTWPANLPQRVADAFGRYFGQYFTRYFGREFGRHFVDHFKGLDHGRDMLREFVREFGRDWAGYSGLNFVRDFGRDFGRDLVPEFVSYFGRDLVPEFVSYFGRDFRRWGARLLRDMGVDPGALNWKTQCDAALDDDNNVQRVLDSWEFWKAIFGREYAAVVDPVVARRSFAATVDSPLALPLALVDFRSIAVTDWILSISRDLHLRYPQGDVPEDVWDQAFATNPISCFWSALAWNEHAKLFQQHHGKLDGALGALMLAHADYASLMTGLDLENAEVYPSGKSLVDTAGIAQIEKLRHFASAPASPVPRPPSPVPRLPSPVPRARARARDPEPLFTYLHLSDMHFGLPAAGDRHNQSTVLAALRDEFANGASKSLPRPDALFLTGDIAWAGKPSDYDAASKWIDEVLKTFGLSADRVFVVPGNHDTDRSATTDRMSKLLLGALRDGQENLDEVLEDDTSLAVLLRRKQAYLEFAKRFAPACHSPEKPPFERLAWKHREQARDGLAVHLVGFDTALLAAGNDDPKKLRIGQAQIALLNDCAPDREFVVVLGHHPLNGEWFFPDEERDVATHVRRRAHVYLAGHVHEHDSARVISGGGNDSVRIVAGAIYCGREQHIPNGHAYNVGMVLPPFDGKPVRLRIFPRRYSFKKAEFCTDTDNVPDGASYADFELPRLKL